ncbi:hypothetical protein [Arthrobacter wenxiniae]|uniref:hypothetical protein n=1 Tax=Arthrobacter wenxiniae TaxID=2713570 RepID=UPI001C400063|nr:hypothetical protein [Arthrobacter wenxiniae]
MQAVGGAGLHRLDHGGAGATIGVRLTGYGADLAAVGGDADGDHVPFVLAGGAVLVADPADVVAAHGHHGLGLELKVSRVEH